MIRTRGGRHGGASTTVTDSRGARGDAAALTEDGRPAVLTEDGRVVGQEDESQRRALGSLLSTPEVDDWVDLSVNGRVRVRTGKVELGQGIRTALTLLAAEELGVDPSVIDVVPATTASGPEEGYTAGSKSIEQRHRRPPGLRPRPAPLGRAGRRPPRSADGPTDPC